MRAETTVDEVEFILSAGAQVALEHGADPCGQIVERRGWDADPALATFASDLESLAALGITVRR